MPVKKNTLVVKLVESVGYPLGAALVALHFFSWKTDRVGSMYYETINEWGIAIGVLLAGVAWVARKWA